MTELEKMRAERLKHMHELMRLANDEDIYDSWIQWMPDEPSQGDFEDIAQDSKEYEIGLKLFLHLMSNKNY